MNTEQREPSRVLFLCTGNSARSILAEVILNERGAGRFSAHSAGSRPTGQVNPAAVRRLERGSHGVEGLASKSWEAFAGTDAPPFDYVITVCDSAAGETCPVWNGPSVRAHWGIPDPAAVEGSDDDVDAAFDRAYRQLSRRIERLLALPLATMDPEQARLALNDIGRNADADG